MSRDMLPVILVSARDAPAAAKIISDLTDRDIHHVGKDSENESDNVWKIVNKYYTVDVRLVPVIDAHDDTQQLHYDEDWVEAHIIYLTEDEVGRSDATQRAAARARVGRRAAVRLALVAASPPAALAEWAGHARYELVPLAGVEDEGGDGDGDEPRGAGRAREALHAHRWRGLVRAPRGEDGEDEDGMEGFAAALGALSSAAAATRALEGAARVDAAEDLVAAFCRALGLHPDDC